MLLGSALRQLASGLSSLSHIRRRRITLLFEQGRRIAEGNRLLLNVGLALGVSRPNLLPCLQEGVQMDGGRAL